MALIFNLNSSYLMFLYLFRGKEANKTTDPKEKVKSTKSDSDNIVEKEV